MISHPRIKAGDSCGRSHIRFYGDTCNDVTLPAPHKTEKVVVGTTLDDTLIVPVISLRFEFFGIRVGKSHEAKLLSNLNSRIRLRLSCIAHLTSSPCNYNYVSVSISEISST